MKTPSNNHRRRAWVEVDLGALRRNAARLSALRPGSLLLPMLKADGYGLGASLVANALEGEGVWGVGVATTEEGLALRRDRYQGRVIVFSPSPAHDAADLLAYDLEPAVTSLDALRIVGRAAARAETDLAVHLEIDTGMARLGIAAADVERWVEELRDILAGYPLTLATTFTHFHSADRDEATTCAQWREFGDAVREMRAAGIDPGPLHSANSAAALRYNEVAADMIRPGIALFGGSTPDGSSEPVVSVHARILDVREVPAGTTVSYGATYTTPGAARLATLAIGYADGFRFELSNRGDALIGGRRAPIRGAVCMDVTVVDVTDVPDAQAGGVATVLGRSGSEQITLAEIANRCGTIEWEILTGLALAPRLPRISVEHDATMEDSRRPEEA